MRPAYIFGTGSYARLLHAYLRAGSHYQLCGFALSGEHFAQAPRTFCDLPVVDFETIGERESPALFLGIGYSAVNAHRRHFFERAQQLGFDLPPFIHPTAHVDASATIGEGCVILERAVVQPFVTIGANTIIWSASNILHDTAVERHVFIAGGVTVSGNCTIGECAFLGAGAVVRDRVRIGHSAVIGAGVTVLEDVGAGEVRKAADCIALALPSGTLRDI